MISIGTLPQNTRKIFKTFFCSYLANPPPKNHFWHIRRAVFGHICGCGARLVQQNVLRNVFLKIFFLKMYFSTMAISVVVARLVQQLFHIPHSSFFILRHNFVFILFSSEFLDAPVSLGFRLLVLN